MFTNVKSFLPVDSDAISDNKFESASKIRFDPLEKNKDPLSRSKIKIRQSWVAKIFENFPKFRKFSKISIFSKSWFFDFQRNFNNFRKSYFWFFRNFRNFRNFGKFSKIFRSQLWRILFFDLLNETFWNFFMDRSEFSRRIELVYQNLHQNQLGKVILHSRFFGHLS